MSDKAQGSAFTSGKHWPALDGLRAAILVLVALRHFNTFWQPENLLEYAYMIGVHLSVPGLDVFFALSGFLITGILIDSKGRDGYYRNFYMRRALRIFPVYYFFLIVWFLVLPNVLPGDTSDLKFPVSTQAWYWTYTTNFLIAIKGGDFPPPRTYHLWSLALEEQFYFIWPAVIAACSMKTFKKVIIGCFFASFLFRVGVYLSGSIYQWGFLMLPGHMDAIMTGCMLTLLVREPAWRGRLERWCKPVWWVGMCAIGGIMLVSSAFIPDDPFTLTFGLTISAIVAAATVMSVISLSTDGIVYKLLSHPITTKVGGYSYAWYIFHWPVMLLINRAGLDIAWFNAHIPTRLGAQLAHTAFFMSTALAVAVASWYLIETPALKLKRFFPYGNVRT